MFKYEITYRYDLDSTYSLDTIVIESEDIHMLSFLFTNRERLEEIESYGTIIQVERFNATDSRYQIRIQEVLDKPSIKEAQQILLKAELLREYKEIREEYPYHPESEIKYKAMKRWDVRYGLTMNEAVCLMKWVTKEESK